MKRQLLISTFSLLALSAPAYAQLGGEIVSDPPTEANTAATVAALGTANTSLAAIASDETLIATSVTTPCAGGADLFQGAAQWLDGLDAILTAVGVSTPAAMASMFPGYVPLVPVSIVPAAIISATGLAEYEAAVQIAQAQAGDIDAETAYFTSIETQNVTATSVLCAIQTNTEAVMAVASQLQMVRQLLITQITAENFKASEELNERAQGSATTSGSALVGSALGQVP